MRKVTFVLDDDLYLRVVDVKERNRLGSLSSALRMIIVKGLEAMEK